MRLFVVFTALLLYGVTYIPHPAGQSTAWGQNRTENGSKVYVPIERSTHNALTLRGTYTPDPSGKYLLVMSHNEKWELWDARAHKQLHKQSESCDCVYSNFVQDGKRLIIVTEKSILIYHLDKYTTSDSVTMTDQFTIRHCAIADGVVAVADDEGATKLYQIDKLKLIGTLKPIKTSDFHGSGPIGIAVSSDGSRVARAYNYYKRGDKREESEELVYVHSITDKGESKEVARIVEVPDELSVYSSACLLEMQMSRDGKYVATYGSRGNVRVWNVNKPSEVVDLDGWKPAKNEKRGHHLPDTVRSFAFSQGSREIVVADMFGRLSLYELSSKLISREKDALLGLGRVYFSTNRKYIAVLTAKTIDVVEVK